MNKARFPCVLLADRVGPASNSFRVIGYQSAAVRLSEATRGGIGCGGEGDWSGCEPGVDWCGRAAGGGAAASEARSAELRGGCVWEEAPAAGLRCEECAAADSRSGKGGDPERLAGAPLAAKRGKRGAEEGGRPSAPRRG